MMTSLKTQTIAAFDFDGTISYYDSLPPFLVHCFGLWTTIWKLAVIAPKLLWMYASGRPRQETKEEVLTWMFKGIPYRTITLFGEEFSKVKLSKIIRPKALEKIQWHKGQGHRLILISASVEIYLLPWAKKIGFDDIITSRLEVDEEGLVTGKLIGKNCRNHEKVRRLIETVGPLDGLEIYAYGDSHGDKELLESSTYPHLKEFE